jgi:cytochrome bd-type quinol oxidase subunit 1
MAMLEASRLFLVQFQFGLVSALLLGFAALGLGLAWMLALWRLAGHLLGKATIDPPFRFWLRVFALVCYATVGFGLLLLVQVAVSWPPLLERVGNVIGPVLAIVTVLTFIVKSTFLSVLLYGLHRVTPARYTFCAVATAVGFTLVVLGVLIVDSWFRAPEGATLVDGRYQVFDWAAVLWNTQVPVQATLVAWGSLLAVCGVVLAVSAHQARVQSDDMAPQGLLAVVVLAGLAGVTLTWPMIEHVTASAMGSAPTLLSLLDGTAPVPLWVVAVVRTSVGLALLLSLALTFGVVQWSGPHPGAEPIRRPLAWTLGFGSVAGVLLWLMLWLLLQMDRGEYLVARSLTVADLVSEQPPVVLLGGLVAIGLVSLLIVGGVVRLVMSVSLRGVIPVHRSRVLP